MTCISALPCFGQDPSGRPKEIVEPKSNKKPSTRKPSGPPEPTPLTIMLTVLTDQPESTVLINGERRGVTDAEGKARFEKLPPGRCTVEVRKEGFKPISRIFVAGSDLPTLVFKLEPSLDDVVAKFDSLISEGKFAGPESPNAFEVLKEVAAANPNLPEVVRMRATLITKVTEQSGATITRSVSKWNQVTREELEHSRNAVTAGLELKEKDYNLQAQEAYLDGTLALRDWMTSNANNANGLKEALKGFEEALKYDQFMGAARYQQGVARMRAGDLSAAVQAFDLATQIEPKWAYGYAGLGAARLAQEKYKDAVEAFEKAIKLDSEYAPAYAGLGQAETLSNQKNGSKSGMKNIEKAMELDPTSGLSHLSLGIINAKTKKAGDRDEAVKELKLAIEKNRDNLEFQNSKVEELIADLEGSKKK